ncbi:unnamed protein product [Pipistrellus nathusii]|uniref:Microsomal glutathione S-transferase 1 n=1 Tax=Pipistrellus nathusii TaxID=59473 RepID=A0ABN9ZUG8_PIPNA
MIKVEKMVDLAQLMENEIFMAFAFYTMIVISKMMFMNTTPAFYRITRKVFANREDCTSFGKGENAKKYLWVDDRVEHVGRAHLNDLENIVPLLGIGLLYSLSGPDLYSYPALQILYWSTDLPHIIIFVTLSSVKSCFSFHSCWIWNYFVNGLQIAED